jgi:hypothetical protein
MAPNLADSQHVQIRDITLSNCPPAEIPNVVAVNVLSLRYSQTFVILAPLYKTQVNVRGTLDQSVPPD